MVIDHADIAQAGNLQTVGVLAGFAGGASTIKNVTVINSRVTADANVSSAGGLVGFLRGGSTVSDSIASVTMDTTGGSIGGLVGTMRDSGTTIRTSYTSGVVKGNSQVGGLVGVMRDSGPIIDSYSTADVSGALSGASESQAVGGLVGLASGVATVQTSYASGRVSGTAAGTTTGGLVGESSTVILDNSYWDSTTTRQSNAIGSGTSTVGAMVNAVTYSQSSYTGFDMGPSGAWFSVEGYTRPFLRMEASNTVTNAHELQLMGMRLANHYTLANNIDLATSLGNFSEMWKDANASSNWRGSFAPVGDGAAPFTGNFNGLGHTISNLTIDRPNADFVGLFGYTDGAVINNIGLLNETLTGLQFTGGLVGRSRSSTIGNAYATGTVTGFGGAGGSADDIGGLVGMNDGGSISNSYAAATVSGHSMVGGLVGENTTLISDSHATGNVSGNDTVGGLVGTNGLAGSIQNAYATGNVTGTSTYAGGLAGSNFNIVTGSHASGTVDGGDWVGGLIGYNMGGTIASAYHTTGTVHGAQYVGGLIGQSASSMGNAISDSYSSGDVASIGSGVGGLVGDAQFTQITNSHSSAHVSGGGTNAGGLIGNAGNVTAFNVYASGDVTANSSQVGGLVGNDASGHYSHTYATGAVEGGTNDNVGGLFGFATNTHIDTSFATGSVHGASSVGGLVGFMLEAANTLEDSYATGAVTGTVTDTGGLVGTVANSTVTNAYSSGLTVGAANVGGLIGNAINSTITNSFWDTQTSGQAASSGGAGVSGKTTAEMKSFVTFSGTTPAWDIVVDPSLTNVYPQLRWAGSGLAAGSTVWVIGRGALTYTVTGGLRTYGQSFVLPTPVLTGGSPTAAPTVRVYDSGNSDVTGQATAGTLPVGTYTVKTLLTDSNYLLASTGNTPGTLTVSQANLNYTVAGGTRSVGQSFVLPTPVLTGGSPTAAPTVRVYDSNNNDVTSQATAGTLAVGTYTVKALLTDSNYLLASSGNTDGVLTITSPVASGGSGGSGESTAPAPGQSLAKGIADLVAGAQSQLPASAGLAASALLAPGTLPGLAPALRFVRLINPLPEVRAAFGPAEPLALVTSPLANEPTRAVSLSQARSMLQGAAPDGGADMEGAREVRVPVSRNSLADIVNGGLRLPEGVEQQLFVVEAN